MLRLKNEETVASLASPAYSSLGFVDGDVDFCGGEVNTVKVAFAETAFSENPFEQVPSILDVAYTLRHPPHH